MLVFIETVFHIAVMSGVLIGLVAVIAVKFGLLPGVKMPWSRK